MTPIISALLSIKRQGMGAFLVLTVINTTPLHSDSDKDRRKNLSSCFLLGTGLKKVDYFMVKLDPNNPINFINLLIHHDEWLGSLNLSGYLMCENIGCIFSFVCMSQLTTPTLTIFNTEPRANFKILCLTLNILNFLQQFFLYNFYFHNDG